MARDNFSADIAIRRVADGLVRVYHSEYESYDDEGNFADYIWSDGNYSCDCNRALFFAWVVGEDDPDRECGDGAFVIDWIKRADTGEILYSCELRSDVKGEGACS